jgi:hypothetical protein
MSTEQDPTKSDDVNDRWTLIRDIAVFQVKLLVDGLRDLILLPVSLVTGLVSLLKGGSTPGSEFYELLRVGRRSERWINLFGAAERIYGIEEDDGYFAAEDIDKLVARVETFVVDEYQKGGVTTQAKERVDQALNRLRDIANWKSKPD